MPSTLSTIPDRVKMGSTESRTFTADVASRFAPGEIPSALDSVLLDLGTRTLYPAGLVGDAVLAGTVLQQTIAGLQPGRAYRLTMIAETDTGKRWIVVVEIRCRR